VLYCIIQNVHSDTLHYAECSWCYIELYSMFIVLYCIVQDVHSATLNYAEGS